MSALRLRSVLAGLVLLALGGCETGPSTRDLPPASELGLQLGYRPANLERTPGSDPGLPGTHMVLAFSGGGMRATALAHGVLRELEATPAPGAAGRTMLDAVDVISAVSGGSVAAANFVVHGRSGYRRIEEPDGFLRHDGLGELVSGVLNPANALYFSTTAASRIELLSDMFRRTMFAEQTYADLHARSGERRPFLVLNAADMASGERFAFTQRQLDMLCLDLRQVRIADAVAASAAFPVALTPLPLPNHSPCPAQRRSPGGIETLFGQPLALAGYGDLAGWAASCPGRSPPLDMVSLPLRARSLRQLPLLNFDPCTMLPIPEEDPRHIRMVHLLDGGTADNLGLDGPLATLTGHGDDARIAPAIADGRVQQIVIIAVNARSQGQSRAGADGSTPGVLSMLLGTINTAIDGRSGGLLAQLGTLRELLAARYPGTPQRPLRVRVIGVDFETIADSACRAAFQGISTTWTLSEREILALQEMASAMLLAAKEYREVAGLFDDLAAEGQARATAACARLL